jgi:hypothetical protein
MAYGSVLTDTVQSSTAATPTVFKDGNGTQIGTLCRAWVNFNGTGTVAIRGSFNVSSITDNGTGNYTVNFTTAMPDANYATMGIGVDTGTDGPCVALTSGGVAAGSVTVTSILPGVAAKDTIVVNVAVFR